MKNLFILSSIIIILSLQSCKVGLDADQAQDFFRGEYIVSDNPTGRIKSGDTITVSYRQSEIFEINNKKCTVYEEDIEKFYVTLSVSITDENIGWDKKVLYLGTDLFTVIQDKGEYNYSRLYPKFDVKTREYIGKFKIIFKKPGLYIFTAREDGSLKFKNINAFAVMKFNKFPTEETVTNFVKDMSEKGKENWRGLFKVMKQENSKSTLFFRVE